ncbi:MAG TPA: hypothetical protein PKA90_13030 [Ignavibacteria bacterium]|nr:hypothetical protein [Ignavibacteria bacterium]HMR41343.1 hypothetical protein [Ignavibacteria bacterium]
MPDKKEKDNIFIEREFKPSVEFVNQFKKSNNRFPTYREYYIWERNFYKDYNSDLTQKEDSMIAGLGTIHYIRKHSDIIIEDQYKFKDVDWSKVFSISVWNGDFTEYYFSWLDNYERINLSPWDIIKNTTLWFLIILIPLLILFFDKNKKPKKSF